ncbi:MAG TPA: acetate kinase, partial [Ideonella sp.]|nr:acetate kinase [Ideonella sp.]
MSIPGQDPADGFVLVLNCGSSSIKVALFDATARPLSRTPAWRGAVQGIGGPQARFVDAGGAATPLALDATQPYHAALGHIRRLVAAQLGERRIAAVAHRVVHGGSRYGRPVRIDTEVLADLERYVPLAPLHQPFAL